MCFVGVVLGPHSAEICCVFFHINSKYAIIRMYQQITTRVHVPIYSIGPGPYNNNNNKYVHYGGLVEEKEKI